MILNTDKNIQAINIPFNWIAEYNDNKMITEYDFNTGKHNSFYDINQEDVVRFGLFGQGMKFYFNASDGSFYLNNKRVDIYYETENKKICLTGVDSRKDLITFKQAYTEYNNRDGEQKSNIESINFGYKTIIDFDDVGVFFQPVVSLPFNNSAYIEVKMTSSKDLDGDLVFFSRRKEIDRFHAPLEKGNSGSIRWTVK